MLRLLTLPIRVAYRTGRRAGAVRVVVFGLGIATGLLVAREPGRDLRERLRRQLADRGAGVPPTPGHVEAHVVVERQVVDRRPSE